MKTNVISGWLSLELIGKLQSSLPISMQLASPNHSVVRLLMKTPQLNLIIISFISAATLHALSSLFSCHFSILHNLY
ncbi:hypothetical protein SLEP1_g51448 [Rubroshorea leprosula]|uniref:Uncharacterized protein n=1 Tax=Rubroshorea leprosula TaxID=152421 RepID=A0AAV5M3F6_9ROSI|nr:hypothetical protein SLEP1_g51448 [Rubroshorea leprosula]